MINFLICMLYSYQLYLSQPFNIFFFPAVNIQSFSCNSHWLFSLWKVSTILSNDNSFKRIILPSAPFRGTTEFNYEEAKVLLLCCTWNVVHLGKDGFESAFFCLFVFLIATFFFHRECLLKPSRLKKTVFFFCIPPADYRN